ncbi:MAG: acetyl-CoA synthetase [Deltaproteobacteria bacterium]|nr:MAG: acetyl-CoA synthetase [Deltaproteobacteria bacterium]
MEMKEFYEKVMEINQMEDLESRDKAAKEFFEKLNKAELAEYFNWAEEIFEGLHVKQRGDQLGLIWVDLETGSDKKFTYTQMAGNGNKMVNFLRRQGIEQGNNMYMMIPIVPETWFASLACLKAGLVVVPTATTMTVRELQFRFETYPPDIILADETSAEVIDEALKITGKEPKVKLVLGERDGWESYSVIERESTEAEGAKIKKDDILFCFFTSGTTGLAKRVGHSAISYPLGHLSTSVMIGVAPGDVHHNLSAPGWAKWAWSSFFAPLNVGATATGFFFKALDGNKYIEAITKYKVNVFCAPPTAWRMFINLDLKKYDFSELKYSVSAGEPLNPEVINQWKSYTGTEIRDFYGQTESTAMIGNGPWMEGKMKFGSFGRPSYMYDIVLVDDDGKEITKPDETGHICVRLSDWRAIGLFTEYIGDPEKMKEVFVGDYYYTGDRAYFDEDNYWWFVGRADDVIKSSDYRVGPFEVESALVEHPAVAEAAVVGSPDPQRYQLVKAYVILNEGYSPSRELALELFKHTINVLAKFKIPRIIQFVDAVPKTISGKIRRVDLREQEIQKKEQGVERAENEYFYWDFPELSSKKK